MSRYQFPLEERNTTFHFGTTGDTPVVGDWNGDGISDIGVFRSSSGNWYLDTTRTGIVDTTFQFGKSGDSVIVGKWDLSNPHVAPVAVFVANPTSGRSPLRVQFTDQSTGNPTSWYWSFGDGATSANQNPVHTYTSNKKTQSYIVSLTVTNVFGSNTGRKTAFITIVKN